MSYHELTDWQKRQAMFDLYLWVTTSQDHFSVQLYALFAKADEQNRLKLSSAYPAEGWAFKEWFDCEDTIELWRQYGVNR